MPRQPSNAAPRPPPSKPKRNVPVTMGSRRLPSETHGPQNHAGSSSSTALAWGEDPWAGMDPGPKSQKQGSKLIEYCDKPGQFWPDGQEPAFKGQKSRKRVFVTTGKRQPRKEITNNHKEINRLKEDARQTQSFHPRTGDIELYHDYSDYEGSYYDEEDFFESLDSDEDPPHTALALPPPTTTAIPDPATSTVIPEEPTIPSIIVKAPIAKWIDRGVELLDPDDLELLDEIFEIPAAVYYKLLPPSDAIVEDILKFKLPDIDGACFTQTADSSFDSARPKDEVRVPTLIPPKAWVYSLRTAVNTAIRDGKRSILHPRLKSQPLPLWILSLWEQANTAHVVQTSWTRAHKWLEDKILDSGKLASPDCYEHFMLARRDMLLVPQCKIIASRCSSGQRNTSQIPQILADNTFLSDTLVDMMVHATIIRPNPKGSRMMIIDTELPESIRLDKLNLDAPISALERTFATGKDLYFPVCIPEISHFVAFNIDFSRRTLCYGDSLNLPARKYSPFIKKLQRWLSVHFRGPFKDNGNTLPHAIQQDSVSCGLFALNTITHNVFGDPLGIPDIAFTRAFWFKRIARLHIQVPQSPLPASTSRAAPSPPLSTPSDSLPTGQTEGVAVKKERLHQLNRINRDKADTRAAEMTRLKQEKAAQEQNMEVDMKEVERSKDVQSTEIEMMEVDGLEELERQKEIARLEEIERQKETERLKELERLEEIERLQEIERQNETERLKELERQKEIERLQEIERQNETERLKEIARLEELERQKERERLERESLNATQPAQTEHVVPDDSMHVDIEPGEIGSDSITKVRDPSPRRVRVPIVAHRSRRSVSPPRQGYYSRRPISPTRPTTYRDYAPSRFDRHPPPRRRSPSPDRFIRRRSPSPDRFIRRRSPSPDRFIRRQRSPSPDRFIRRRSPSPDRFIRRGRSPPHIGDRGYHPPQTTRYRSPVQRRRRTPSPRRYSGPSAHVAMPPPTIVPAPHPSIPGTLALPMGLLQFMPSTTVTSAAAFNRMGFRPVQNKTTHFILARMSSLSQCHDDNPLFLSLQNNTQSPLLRTACYPPYHGLYVISRGRLVVSNKTEIRLRLWRAQYPTVPLWFFAIRCLSRGLDWRVFANPRHLIGPLQSISCPRPAYLDHTPPLLTRGYGEFERYADSVMEMLRLPFARRFCTMGGLVWRLAMQYGPDNLFSCALSGPSSDAYMHSNADLIGADIDDKVKDAHLQLLLGVTVDGQSLWPPIDVFENHMQWEGEWNANLETWFIKHVTAIQNRETRAFATHSQWSSRLWQHNTTSSKDGTRVVTEAQAQLLCYDIDQLDPRSFAALD